MLLKNYLSETDFLMMQKASESAGRLGRSERPVENVAELIRYLSSVQTNWNNFISHSVRNGRKTNRLMMTSARNTTLDGFLNRKCGYMRDYTDKENSRLMDYDFKNYKELCYMETAMLIWKYEEGLTKQELKAALLLILIRFFRICIKTADEKSTWIYRNGDFESIFEELMDTPCGALKEYFDMIEQGYMPEVRTSGQDVCSEEEYYSEMLDSGATKAELIKEYMRMHNCSRRTSYRRLKEMGFTREYKFKEEKL